MTIATGESLQLVRRVLPALLAASVLLPTGLALNYALNVVVARALPVEGYGLFVFVHSLGGILAMGAALGFSTSMMRLVAGYRAQGEKGLLRGLVGSSLRVIILAAGSSAILLALLGWSVRAQQSAFFWTAALLLPLTIDVWRESTMRGLHRTTAAILPRQVLLPAFTLSGIWVLGLSTAHDVLLCYVALLVLLELVGLGQLKSALAIPVGWPYVTRTREWLRISLPMAGANLARLGMTRWDIVVIGLIIGLEAAGPYAAAARTALLASLVLRVVNLVVGPILAEFYHSGNMRDFRRLLVVAAVGAGVAGLPLYLLVMLYPQWVLGIFGPAYTEGALLLQILATGQFINLVTGPVGLALTMSAYETADLRITLGASLFSVVALLVLVPSYGAVGAAFAVGSAIALLNLATVAYAWRKFS